MKSNELNDYRQPVGFAVENWQGRTPPEKILLKGRYCNLIPLDPNLHTKELFDVLNKDNPGDSWTYLPYGPFATHQELKNWLQIKNQETDTLLYVIADSNTEQVLGISGYLRICHDHGVIEIGHLHFSKQLQQTRLATEAIYLMIAYVFDVLSYRRCEWKCHHLNTASKKAAERFGFTFEGIFRQSHVFKNRNRDTAWFSVLDHEWPRLKNKFQKWLDPSNFDAHGKQLIPLKDI